MVKLLSTLSLILAIVLFPPAALALVSNNAVPGDATYPIKRGLEDVIYAAASLNPTTKAWFAGARSNRRYEEVTALLAQGKTADQSLNELVEQTQIAALQIKQVSDPVEKQKLITQLSDSITKYDQGLAEASQKRSQSSGSLERSQATVPVPVMTSSPSTALQPVSRSESTVMPGSSAIPQASSAPRIVEASRPTVAPQAPVVPAATVVPQPTVFSNPATPPPAVTPAPPPPTSSSNIDRARQLLEETKNDLEKERSSESVNEMKVKQPDQKDNQEKTDRGSNKKGKGND